MFASGEMEDRFESLLKPLLVGFAAVLLSLLFAYLASEVLEGDTAAFDTRILHAAQALRAAHPWLSEVGRDFGGLGSVSVMALFTSVAVGYLLLVSARATALLLAASVILGAAANSLFKSAFGRSRPDPAFAEFSVPSLSFPSGHASMAAIVFLTLGTMLASTRKSRIERAYLLSMAATFAMLIGLSRVLLGVHWATDVLGGWAFGAAWAMGWLLLARFAEGRDVARSVMRHS
jgi:undecaprenyl-diphosphatase